MAQTILTDDTLLHADGPPPQTPRLLPGTVISHYEITGPLGMGGMGAVYKARDQRIGRSVAIKLTKPGAEAQTSCRLLCTLLMREGQAMGQLSHPNILAVYDVGTVRGCVFLAIEYVEGATLRQWARDERTLRERVDACLAAGRGLEAAHAAGVIHRDYKPDNVLVGEHVVKVCDFGLARTRAQILDWGVSCGGCGARDAATELASSVDNDVVGTPRYMAPEQHAADPATEASDQYAFAVSTWEVVCGTYPFIATTLGELRVAIESSRVSEPLHAVPSGIVDVLRRGMSADPAARYPSLRALLDPLEASLTAA